MSRRMSMREAMDLVDDDLPDGVYWGLVHEMAGLEYGDGFDELLDDDDREEVAAQEAIIDRQMIEATRFECPDCKRRFGSREARRQHAVAKGHQVCRLDVRKPQPVHAGVVF